MLLLSIAFLVQLLHLCVVVLLRDDALLQLPVQLLFALVIAFLVLVEGGFLAVALKLVDGFKQLHGGVGEVLDHVGDVRQVLLPVLLEVLPVYFKEFADARGGLALFGRLPDFGGLLVHLLLEGFYLLLKLPDAVLVLLLAQRLELGDGGLGGGDFRLVLLFHRHDALFGLRHQRFGDVGFGTLHDGQFLLRFEGYGLPFLFEQVFKQSQLVFVEACPRFGVVLLLALVLVVGDGAVNLRDGGFPPLLHLQQFRRVAVGEALAELLLEGLELLAQFLVLLRHFLHLFGAGGAVNLFDGFGHVLPYLVGEVFGRLPLAGGERLDAFNEVAVLLPNFLLVGGDLVQTDEFVLLEEFLHLLLEVLPFGQFLPGDLFGGLAACTTAAAAVRLALYVGDNRVQLVADPRGEVLFHLLNLGLFLLHNLGDVADP